MTDTIASDLGSRTCSQREGEREPGFSLQHFAPWMEDYWRLKNPRFWWIFLHTCKWLTPGSLRAPPYQSLGTRLWKLQGCCHGDNSIQGHSKGAGLRGSHPPRLFWMLVKRLISHFVGWGQQKQPSHKMTNPGPLDTAIHVRQLHTHSSCTHSNRYICASCISLLQLSFHFCCYAE